MMSPWYEEALDVEVPVWCNDHGRTFVAEESTGHGFTGAPIFWTLLACGCTQMDASLDTLEWVK